MNELDLLALKDAYKAYEQHQDEALSVAIKAYVDALPTPDPDPDPTPDPDPDPTPDPDPDPTPDPDPVPGRFRVFESIGYRGGPDYRQFGMEPLKIYYESAFFSDKKRQGAYENLSPFQPYPRPDLSRVASVAANAPEVSCVDIERYWNSYLQNGDETIDARAIDVYIAICTAYNDALPRNHKFGLYSTLPLRSYWPVIRGNKLMWQATNTSMKGVGAIVDMTFPSIYTFYTDSDRDQDRWEVYAIAQIVEAKRIAPNKPCYPFLWPQFHSGSDDHVGKPIPREYFRRQLKLVRRYADGVVIWTRADTKNIPFIDIPNWWDALLDEIS